MSEISNIIIPNVEELFPDYNSFSDQEKLELKENFARIDKREERLKTNFQHYQYQIH
jgi:hypothetical protein